MFYGRLSSILAVIYCVMALLGCHHVLKSEIYNNNNNNKILLNLLPQQLLPVVNVLYFKILALAFKEHDNRDFCKKQTWNEAEKYSWLSIWWL